MMKDNKFERDNNKIMLFINLFCLLTIPIIPIIILNILYEISFKTNVLVLYLGFGSILIPLFIVLNIVYYIYIIKKVGPYYTPPYYSIDNVIEFTSRKHYFVKYENIIDIKEFNFYNKIRKSKHLMKITLKQGIHFEYMPMKNEDLSEFLLIAVDIEDYNKLMRNYRISKQNQPVEAKILKKKENVSVTANVL